MSKLKAPFPYFGGKSRVAGIVWQALGDVPNYVEPFAGSLAVLLARDKWQGKTETVNDADGLLANFWRSMVFDPDTVAQYADNPVNEIDLHARHLWLVEHKDEITNAMLCNPEYCNPRAAGYWVWGICCWIGHGWCAGTGPWRNVDGVFAKGDAGRGVHRQIPLLGWGRGVNRKIPKGTTSQNYAAVWLDPVADRIRRVLVCCGDWSRVCGETPTTHTGLTGVFLDPPYSDKATRCDNLYATDNLTVAHDVRAYCLERGDDPKLRIVLAGYDGEHNQLEEHGWRVVEWKANCGYGNRGNGQGRVNAKRERLWLSPHCLPIGADETEIWSQTA